MKNILILLSLLFCLHALQGQTTHQVTVSNFNYSPANLTIQQGDMVQWTNTGGTHNVRANDLSFRCANGCDDTGGNGNPSSMPWTFTRTFNTPGTIGYNCQLHGGGGMAGIITVAALPPPACTNLSSPAHESIEAGVNDALNWTAAVGTVSGYRLDIGTTPGGIDILNNFNVGNVTTYNPPGEYPNNANIYVKIIPFNGGGSATECLQEFFTTAICSSNRMLNGLTLLSGTYSALGDLTSQSSTVVNGRTVVFTLDTGVLLQQEFTVATGAIFDALIQTCGGN